MHIILYEPEIPPNTGNVARLCAGTGLMLHLIEPLGFRITDKDMKRAGLDYWDNVELKTWKCLDEYLEAYPKQRIVCTSARQGMPLQHFNFTKEDSIMFGPETRGLPADVLAQFSQRVRIPTKNAIRSLNLSTSVGIVAFFALNSIGKLEDWL